MKLRFFWASVLVVVFGCAGFAETPPGKGTVWLYRPISDRSDLSPIIYLQEGISSRKLARLDKGQFFGIVLSAGSHAFSWTNTPARGEQFVVPLEPGQHAYLEVKFHSIAWTDGAVVDSRGLRPVDVNNVYDLAVIVPAQGFQIPDTAAGSRIASSRASAPAPKTADPASAVATLPSASAPPSPPNPAATFTSDGSKLRGPQTRREGEE